MREITKDEKAVIRSGINSPFWQLIKELITEDMKAIRELALADSKDFTLEDREYLRRDYLKYKYLVNFPDSLIKEDKEYEKTNEDDGDPYPKTKKYRNA